MIAEVALGLARHPQGVAAAHVRLLLEPWAAARSGTPVEFERLPG